MMCVCTDSYVNFVKLIFSGHRIMLQNDNDTLSPKDLWLSITLSPIEALFISTSSFVHIKEEKYHCSKIDIPRHFCTMVFL